MRETNEIWQMGVAEIADAVRTRRFSCKEVMEAHFERIETINAKVNAITVCLKESAMDAADQADNAIFRGEEIGPLLGVPMTIKENIDLAGSATTMGVAAMGSAIAQTDAPHVSNLRHAGAIPIGRTNMPDLGLRPHTDNELRGATLNPWDFSRTPGGSSGGDAVAVATGMSPLGIGNDYGGSLRGPAQYCGVATIRPTLGRVPDHYMAQFPEEPSITCQLFMVEGPLVRHVRDLKIVLETMSKRDVRDPWWIPAPMDGPSLAKPIRVAMTIRPGGQKEDPEISKGVKKAAASLSDAGYLIEEIDPPAVSEAWEAWLALTSAEINKLILPRVRSIASPGSLKFLEYWVGMFPEIDFLTYMQRLAERNRIARQWAEFQEKYPLILGPVLGIQPFKVDYDISSKADFEAVINSYKLMMAVNFLGLPAVGVPMGLAGGLPQGIQIIGPRFREDLCLDAAERLEQSIGSLTPIDPVSAT